MKTVQAFKVLTPEDRAQALQVIETVYLQEKQWIRDPQSEIPADPAGCQEQSWFLVAADGAPAGVIRLVYDPPLEMPAEYGVTLEPSVDLDALKRQGRFVDIGRFMIVPRYRRNIRVVMKLMRAALIEVVAQVMSEIARLSGKACAAGPLESVPNRLVADRRAS